jgi:hypothetical protein
MDCGLHTGEDVSGDTYHQRVVVVHVHDSLLLFCLHPVKMVVGSTLAGSPRVCGSIPIMAGTGIATLGNRADAHGSFVPLWHAHNLLTPPSFVDRIPSWMSPVITSCSISLK